MRLFQAKMSYFFIKKCKFVFFRNIVKNMQFIDTHTHIYLPNFDLNRQEELNNCKLQQVNKLILPNIDTQSLPQLKNVLNANPNFCYAAIGLHPGSIRNDYKTQLSNIANELDNTNSIAIGEIGIDLYWDENKIFINEQKEAFRIQLDWAIKYDLPVIIHSRNAFNEILPIMQDYKNKLNGVFHCFSSSLEIANTLIGLGYYLGIGGVVTFKNSNLPKVLQHVPLSKIVLETDAPFLAPHPYRGKQNKSSYIPIIAQKLTEIYHTTIENIAHNTTNNALNLFKGLR